MTWRARITEEPGLFPQRLVRLMLAEDQGTAVVVVRTPPIEFVRVAEGANAPTDTGIVLPADVLVAIRDAIDDQLGRRYDESLVEELRNVIDIERDRVDRFLSAAVLRVDPNT